MNANDHQAAAANEFERETRHAMATRKRARNGTTTNESAVSNNTVSVAAATET